MPRKPTTEAKPELTSNYLDTLVTKPATTRLELRHKRYPGLELRTKPGMAAGTFNLLYRAPATGVKARCFVGLWPTTSLSEAAEIAASMRVQIRRGEDPRDERQRVIAEAEAEKLAAEAERLRIANAMTFARLVDQFITRYSKIRKSSWANDHRNLQVAVAEWGPREPGTIKRGEIASLLDTVAATTPVKANRLHASLSKVFAWAADAEIIPASPMTRMAKRTVEIPKSRILNDDEFRVLWQAVESSGAAAGVVACFQFLALTGLRPNEGASLQWLHIRDLDGADPRIELPPKSVKNRKGHVLPLCPMAAGIVRQQRDRIDAKPGGAVFGSKLVKRDAVARASVSRLVARVIPALKPAGADAAAVASLQADPVTTHDLRRGLATGLARLGVSREDRLAVLNHAINDVHSSVYDQHLRTPQMRHALALWEQHVARLLNPEPAASNVVPMMRA